MPIITHKTKTLKHNKKIKIPTVNKGREEPKVLRNFQYHKNEQLHIYLSQPKTGSHVCESCEKLTFS